MTSGRSVLSNIMQVGFPAAAAFELASQVLAGAGNAQRLIDRGLDANLAAFVVSAIADAVAAGHVADISYIVSLIVEFLQRPLGLSILGLGPLSILGFGTIQILGVTNGG